MLASFFAWDLAMERGDAPCVRDDNLDLTYREFSDHVDAFAAQLAGRGVRAGDVVALMLPNRVELLVALMAAWRIGAVATPINPKFTSLEAEYQVTDSGAVLVVNEGQDAPPVGRPAIAVDEMQTVVPLGWQPETAAGSDVALLIYTSGSTGRPKGVMLTYDNLYYMGSALAEHLSLTEDDHCLLILPLFHVNALCISFLAPILAGGQLSITGRFSTSRFFEDVARLRPTYFSAVPAIYAMLVSQADDVTVDTSSLRFAISGAAPISKELLRHAEQRFGLTILEGYGLTEGTCVSTLSPLDGPHKLGSVGKALAGQEVGVVSEGGSLLPPGSVGEVVVRGPNVMQGYLGRREETAETVVDGWLHTGDVGHLDEDGYLTLVDRIKDVIIRGGENIYPKEIENALASHERVLEAAVVGAPHDVYGEVPVAYVVTYPDRPVAEGVLLEHLLERVTKVKLPVAIYFVDALPRNPVGKIDKPGLRTRHQPHPASS
ncbi:class I adenylate-forming enzyme family protein [Dietzia lutea]|uniref:AMP-dependent synthetase n=1 Tax=Dietzia lutea TaxID=546160 RepID=A0A2S1R3Q4_9ACTN|nr:AMP-binding protein [Dietzia lutea]AWH90928.1 AMP-dependent synthetase [Dietzia lutea]